MLATASSAVLTLILNQLNPSSVGTDFGSQNLTSIVLYSAQYHRQHCTLQSFEQFGPLYMYNIDDKYPTRPGFKLITSEFRATTGSNEPLGVSRSEAITVVQVEVIMGFKEVGRNSLKYLSGDAITVLVNNRVDGGTHATGVT